MFTASQAARMMGVKAPNGNKRDEWFRSYGITSLVEGPKHGRGFQRFATSEAEILAAAKRVEMARLHQPSVERKTTTSTLWESSKFVGNQALSDRIEGLQSEMADTKRLLVAVLKHLGAHEDGTF